MLVIFSTVTINMFVVLNLVDSNGSCMPTPYQAFSAESHASLGHVAVTFEVQGHPGLGGSIQTKPWERSFPKVNCFLLHLPRMVPFCLFLYHLTPPVHRS
jgi:hypothetical protein